MLKMCRRPLLTKIALSIADMVRVYHSASKLSGGNALLEQDVKLAVGPALWFWETEEGPEKAAEACSGIEEASFGAPIPRTWVQHAGREDVADN
jgi:hypothetical protein